MRRKIVEINEEKCNGCGACAKACHEAAIVMVNGKAKLLKEDYCDGLGDCLPACPTGAIQIEEKEAAEYDHEAVQIRVAQLKQGSAFEACVLPIEMNLNNWPVQLQLAPVSAPYYQNKKLVVASDCSGFAYPKFHQQFITGNTVVIGCPKLDAVRYSDKLTDILRANDIQEMEVVIMEVPCCKGLQIAVQNAIEMSGKKVSLSVTKISCKGEIL